MHGRRAFVEGGGCSLREGGDSLLREGWGHLSREGEAICQGKELFVKGGGRLLIKGGGKLVIEAGEPISQGKDEAIVKGGRTAVHWKRMDASHLLREGGCQPFVERGRMPAWEREDAGSLLREGGCWPFIKRWRSLFVETGRRPPFIVVGGKNNEFLPCWEIRSSTMSEFQVQWTWTNCSLWLEVVHTAFKGSISEKDEPSWHRHVYKRYDNVDTNLWLKLPPIWCQGKAGVRITDVWHMSDWPLTLYSFSWLLFLLSVTCDGWIN